MFGHEKDGVTQFDRVARYYDRYFGRSSPNAHRVVVEVLQRQRTVGRVLDIGSGTGLLLQEIQREIPATRELYGIDPATGMINVAQERLPDVEFVKGSAEALPWGDGRFDLVVSSESFGHWRNQDQGMREIYRVLEKGGLAVIVDHRPPRGIRRKLFWVAGTLPRYREAKEIANLALQSSFEVIDSHNRDGYAVTVLRKGFTQ